MKKGIYLFISALLFATMVVAQPPQGGPQGGFGGRMNPEEMVKRQTDEMVKNLGLDAKQTEKVSAINKKYAEKMSSLFQQSQNNMEGMREKMTAMNTQKSEELKAVLTADQYAKYVDLEKKRMERFRQQRPGGGAPSPEKRAKPRGTGDE